MQELDIPAARNKSFEAKSNGEVAKIAIAGFENQNTKPKRVDPRK